MVEKESDEKPGITGVRRTFMIRKLKLLREASADKLQINC